MADSTEQAERVIPLARMSAGEHGKVCSLGLAAAQKSELGPMGLRERSCVRVCRVGEPCIVEVGCAPGMCRRIGLSRLVAQRVMVTLD